MELVQPKLCRNSLCHRLGVTGQHDRFAYTGVFQRTDGSSTVWLDHVCNDQTACIAAVHCNVHDRAHLGHGGGGKPQLFHQTGIAAGNGIAVYGGSHAVAAQLFHAGHPCRVKGLAVGIFDAQGDGMSGPALCKGGGFHELFRCNTRCGVDAHHCKAALRQGAGLIEYDHPGTCQLFQIGRAFDEDAAGARAADAPKEAQRDRDDQRTRAGDDEEGQCTVDPVAKAGGLAEHQKHQRRQECQRQSAVAHRRGIDPRKAGDEVLCPRFFHAGVLHQIQNFGNGGFAKFPGGADPEQTGHVDTAADDLIPGGSIAGQALAGEGSGVQRRSTFHDHAVDGHPLTGLYHDDAADLDLVRVDLLQLTVRRLDVGVVRADVHQGTDGLAALAHGNALEQLAHLIEQDNGTAFQIFAQSKCAHRGNRHQEALVKGLAVLDALDRFAQNVLADYDVGDQVEHQLYKGGQRRQQCQHDLQNDQQRQRKQDLL